MGQNMKVIFWRITFVSVCSAMLAPMILVAPILLVCKLAAEYLIIKELGPMLAYDLDDLEDE